VFINWDEVKLTMGHRSTQITKNKYINLKFRNFKLEILNLFVLLSTSGLRASEVNSLKYINQERRAYSYLGHGWPMRYIALGPSVKEAIKKYFTT